MKYFSFKKFKFFSLIILLLFVVSFAGTVSASSNSSLITDAAGREVEVPAEPQRLAAVGPGAVRLVVYLQEQDKLVGVEDFEKKDKKRPYIQAHPGLSELPSLGPQFGGDAELIAAHRPDLILKSFSTARQARSLQKKTGIPVVVIIEGSAGSLYYDELESSLKLTAEVLNREKRAETLLKYYRNTVADLKEMTDTIAASDKKSAYVGGIGQKGAHGILSTEPGYPPFSYINVKNTAREIGVSHAHINPEKLLSWNPEYIFIDEGGLTLAVKDLREKKFSCLQARRQEQIYGLLPYNYYTTNFATLLANAYFAGKILYPDTFSEINPEAKAGEIYEFFVGKDVYQEMAAIFGGFKTINIEN